uniref:Uncharacterized protein n=1 Tax=Moniliophthora roreri TaxID=221103 RepID=A0A0W0GFR2_MONRR
MLKGEPYKGLPSTSSNTAHPCARFFDVQDVQDPSPNLQGTIPLHYLIQLNIELRLIGKGISFDFPIANGDDEGDDIGIATIHSNYHYDVSCERTNEVMARLYKVFGSDPGSMWYLSSKNYFDPFCNHTVPISRIDKTYGPR